jgi:hypothetical protein
MRAERDGRIVETGRSPQAFAGKHHVGRNPEQVIRHLRRAVGVEHDGQSALARCLTKRPHEIGKSIVDEHRSTDASRPAVDAFARECGEHIVTV